MNSIELVPGEPVELVVDSGFAGWRLDAFLARMLPTHSRVQLRRVINALGVRIEGVKCKASYRLSAGQRVTVVLPDLPRTGPEPEDIPLEILFEDGWLAAINKPPGMVVHPARGHWNGTLTAALAFHFQQLSSAGGPTRPGVVHRLDRDTSGVILVAKNDRAHLALAAQFEARTVEKEYLAVVLGCPDKDRDLIQRPIGLHPIQREKMAIRADHESSRDAVTMYEVAERFDRFASVRVLPKTGRTHQIRVHLAHLGHPVLCDRMYGGRSQVTAAELAPQADQGERVVLDRQALHARRIRFAHPKTGEPLECVAPLPADLQLVLDLLRQAK